MMYWACVVCWPGMYDVLGMCSVLAWYVYSRYVLGMCSVLAWYVYSRYVLGMCSVLAWYVYSWAFKACWLGMYTLGIYDVLRYVYYII